tara:strand:+ start:400 stop:666 length:267 start_codon:yes stop_codon:yes gene_type:complete
MTIPEVRKELRRLALQLRAPRLNELANELTRRPYVRKARVKSAKMTDVMEASIKAFAGRQRHLSFVEIAQYYNINPGRVSEVLAGKRT